MTKDITPQKIDDCKYRIPKDSQKGMRVDGIIYADQRLMESILRDRACAQVANVASLPGIVNYSLAMPDIHWGYGFCIGGVAATDPSSGGVISPGGVGYDINCGVRLVRTNLTLPDVKNKAEVLVNHLYNSVPSGVGSKGNIKLNGREQEKVMLQGAAWAVASGMGVAEDLVHCEEKGAISGALPDAVSERACRRGISQVGTLGSGNHFLEVQVVDDVFDEKTAEVFGLFKGQITVMIHSGSRGFGYQICDEYARRMIDCLAKYGIDVPDRQLACAPVNSPEGKAYIGAMCAAANYAWANRQVLTHLVRESFAKVFGKSWQSLGMSLIYDVAHNIAKFEEYSVGGVNKKLCVHRKGATRALGPGHKSLPSCYQGTGQPVIIPGDMGRASYLLTGTKKAEQETFGSACHGAGRLSSRAAALRSVNFEELIKELKSKNIEVRSATKRSLIEEAPSVYKNIDDVVEVVDKAGLSKKVCRMRPVCVVKG